MVNGATIHRYAFGPVGEMIQPSCVCDLKKRYGVLLTNAQSAPMVVKELPCVDRMVRSFGLCLEGVDSLPAPLSVKNNNREAFF